MVVTMVVRLLEGPLAVGQVQGQIDALFRIRWRGDYTPATKDRVVFDSVNYDIVSVVPVGRNEAWDILARARNV